jgi:hypothetical protein
MLIYRITLPTPMRAWSTNTSADLARAIAALYDMGSQYAFEYFERTNDPIGTYNDDCLFEDDIPDSNWRVADVYRLQ